jgi:hypothetical protein
MTEKPLDLPSTGRLTRPARGSETSPQASLVVAKDPVWEQRRLEFVKSLFLRTRSLPSHWRASLAREIEVLGMALLDGKSSGIGTIPETCAALRARLLLALELEAFPTRAALALLTELEAIGAFDHAKLN